MGLVIVGVPFYVLVLSKGFAGVAAMPAAIPIAAVALAIIVGIGHRLTGSGPQAGRMPYRRGNPAAGIAVGLAMIVGGIFMSFKAGADVRRYDADASCTAGFGGAPVAGGMHARPRRDFPGLPLRTSQRRRVHDPAKPRRLDDQRGRAHAIPRRRVLGRRNGDKLATVQYFDGKVAQVETQSGRVATADMPIEREKFWTLMGLVGGGFGLMAAIGVLVRGMF